MPRRTAEASRAVREAWIREQELVADGKGTRDWTPEQQKEILERGKAYYHSDDPDDVNDGKAFEGHHMKSAEAYPEYQGEAANIQFLSRPEHQEAHGGDFRNPTNGYFNPTTKVIFDFGDNIFIPCKVINLSKPLSSLSSTSTGEIAAATAESQIEKSSANSNAENRLINPALAPKESPQRKATVKVPPPGKDSHSKLFTRIINKGVRFYGDNKESILTVAKIALLALVKLGLDVATTKLGANDGYSSSSEDLKSPYRMKSDGHSSNISLSVVESELDDESTFHDYLSERSSPEKHTVKRHGQHYNTKEGRIWKEKDPYSRGGKHDKE